MTVYQHASLKHEATQLFRRHKVTESNYCFFMSNCLLSGEWTTYLNGHFTAEWNIYEKFNWQQSCAQLFKLLWQTVVFDMYLFYLGMVAIKAHTETSITALPW